MATMTIGEGAHHLGVTEATIRSWVLRGYVKPVRRGAKPLRFHEEDLIRCHYDRMSAAEHARLDALWERCLTLT